MLRLPFFTYHQPGTVAEAVALAAKHGAQARFVAGGTDLYPNMKRRHQTPEHVIALRGVRELVEIHGTPQTGMSIGAMALLADLEQDQRLREAYPAFVDAIKSISTPLLRNMGTIGGNLLLDTRCTYYDQTFEWRQSIDFCMKRDGPICWVAPSSPRCLAVQSADTVPLLTAIGAQVTLAGPQGERRIPIDDLYRDDGIHYTTKRADELLTKVHLPAADGWRASYRKLRRRDTFDFPVLGVGVWLRRDGDVIADLRVRIGGAASKAVAATDTEALLRGQVPNDELLAQAAQAAFKPTRAMDNTDHEAAWRKKMAPVFVARALRDCL